MRLRLLDVMIRPWRTSRELIRLLRDVHLNVEFEPAKSKDAMSDFVVIGGRFMMPSGVFNMIKSSIVLVEYDYVSGHGKVWKRKPTKDQNIDHDEIPLETAVVMLVNERMDKANGK